jgi:hypothetical protein
MTGSAGRDAHALVEGLGDLDLTAPEAAYVRSHARRYEVLLDVLGARAAKLPDRSRPLRILDVGPAAQTELIRRAFAGATVSTLGYANRLSAPRDGEGHFDFDLNDAASPGRRPDVPPQDIVVAAEVIEHLAVSPRAVFECFAAWAEGGGWLVLQTPNAVALHKRARALVGRNPLGAAGDVGAGSHSAAHFREYTVGELDELAIATGFEPGRAIVGNYFRHSGFARTAWDRLTEALPAGTRQGITAYFRRR